jgi:hypothetical protein
VKAKTRRRTPVAIRSSTWALTFSTPASANTTGVVAEGVALDWLREARPHCSPAQTYQRAATPRSVARSCRSPRAGRRASRRSRRMTVEALTRELASFEQATAAIDLGTGHGTAGVV